MSGVPQQDQLAECPLPQQACKLWTVLERLQPAGMGGGDDGHPGMQRLLDPGGVRLTSDLVAENQVGREGSNCHLHAQRLGIAVEDVAHAHPVLRHPPMDGGKLSPLVDDRDLQPPSERSGGELDGDIPQQGGFAAARRAADEGAA